MSSNPGKGLRGVIIQILDVANIELRTDDERGGLMPGTRQSWELVKYLASNATGTSRPIKDEEIAGQLTLEDQSHAYKDQSQCCVGPVPTEPPPPPWPRE